MKTNKDASERTFQEEFVKGLTEYRWDAPDYLNGNLKRVTIDDLIDNWRSELNRINADKLEGIPLTDNEFRQVMAKVNQIANSYEAAKILAAENSKGKIDGIYRDKNPHITKDQLTLTIFNKAAVSGGDSSYKIAREVVSNKKGGGSSNKFDLILLINGLPLINVELKRTDINLKEAFGQFKRYYADGEYSFNFMAFSQMMVMSTEIETRYFATPKSLEEFNPSFVFNWSDSHNRAITDWKEIIKEFLMIPMAHSMVGDYLIIDEAKDAENRRHMLMRPYQVHALRAIEGASMGTNNELQHGGYIWHTTGSGKTITSFKTALFLSTRVGFDKVIFLVDRRELDSRTTDNFKAYAEYESVTVDDTNSTFRLKKTLNSLSSGIVVTTIFKLNNLVCELDENQDYTLANKKFVFIIDEAHRTTMGSMMGNIKKYFRKNGLFYGFTGTPLFDENMINGKAHSDEEKNYHVINTTEKVFGPRLHQYTIDEAIRDRNVLGFNIDYINTGEFLSYEDLRGKLSEAIIQRNPDRDTYSVERFVQNLNETEIEKEAIKYKLFSYQDKTHIPRVVEHILSNWEKQSQDRKFNAILTVAYKQRVIDYYNEFKKQMEAKGIKINIAMTFSFGNENDPDNISPEIIKMMFKDYAAFRGIEFVAGDRIRGEEAYFQDVVETAAKGGSGRNPKYIDLVIVADQLLTGYDSKWLNTLYVDRYLELQSLIQAYSRTNRILGANKDFGSIINFQYPRITQENVNKALTLYGSGGSSSPAIVDQYNTAVDKLRITIENLKTTLSDLTRWAELKDSKEKREDFFKAFRESSTQLNKVKQYYEFKWDEVKFGIDQHTWLNYLGVHKNLSNGKPESDNPVIDLVGDTKIVGSQIIDAGHIIQLIGDKIIVVDGQQTVNDETKRLIFEQIQELSNMGEETQAKLIKQFVDEELIPGKLSSNSSFDEEFKNWKTKKRDEEVKYFAEDLGLDTDLVIKSVDNYSYLKPDDIPYIDEISKSADLYKVKNPNIKTKLQLSMKVTRELPQFISETKPKYE